jgi:serine/threonine protein kinase
MYIVMEHCAGGTLADIMPNHRFKGSADPNEKWRTHSGTAQSKRISITVSHALLT